MKESDFDILAITESHLSNSVKEEEIHIVNHRKDRNNGLTPWGGVAIYYKDHFKCFRIYHGSECYLSYLAKHCNERPNVFAWMCLSTTQR